MKAIETDIRTSKAHKGFTPYDRFSAVYDDNRSVWKSIIHIGSTCPLVGHYDAYNTINKERRKNLRFLPYSDNLDFIKMGDVNQESGNRKGVCDLIERYSWREIDSESKGLSLPTYLTVLDEKNDVYGNKSNCEDIIMEGNRELYGMGKARWGSSPGNELYFEGGW